MNKSFFLWCCTCTLGAALLQAQEPFQIPSTGTWTIDIRSAQDATAGDPISESPPSNPKKSGPIRAIRVVQTGTLRKDTIVWSNGTTSDLWRIDGQWLGQLPKGPVVAVSIFKEDFPFDPWKPFEVQDLLAYISKGKPTETNLSGAPVLLYEGKRQKATHSSPATAEAPRQLTTYQTQLWVDPKTRLPVAIKDDEFYYIFRFSNDPVLPLQPSADFCQEKDRFVKRSRVPVPQPR